MTNEEALNFAKSTRADGIITAAVKDYSFWECVIEALEKQIPKKPDYFKEHNIIYFDWKCPNCGREYVNATHGVNHCVDCGQKIDWREL